MATDRDDIEEIKKMAEAVEVEAKEYGLHSLVVDDWGRFGNFSLIAYLDTERGGYRGKYIVPWNKRTTFSVRKIMNVLKRHLKGTGGHLRSYYLPKCIGRGTYDEQYITIDVDYQTFCQDANVFQENGTGKLLYDGSPRPDIDAINQDKLSKT